MSPRILIVTFAVLTATLLVGQRFGFTWAGGEGYEAPVLVEILEVDEREDDTVDVFVTSLGSDARGLGFTIARGQTFHTENARARLRIGNTNIAVDERTTIEFLVLTEEEIVIRFPRGRMYVDRTDATGIFKVITNYHESTYRIGIASFVNYDFKETVSVIPINTSIAIHTKLDEQTLETQIPIDIHETKPVERTNQVFHMDEGAAADFYAWAMVKKVSK